MEVKEFLQEQHKRIGILKRTLRGKIANKLFTIQKFIESVAIRVLESKKISSIKDNWFVFSCSARQIANFLGESLKTIRHYIILASSLGLVKRIAEAEANGQSSDYGKDGIGIQQYKLKLIDMDTVRNRWRTWVNSGTRIKDLTISKIRTIFGNSVALEIDTHPEARNISLRIQEKEYREQRTQRIIDRLKEDTKLPCAELVVPEVYELMNNLPNENIRLSYLVSRWNKTMGQEKPPE